MYSNSLEGVYEFNEKKNIIPSRLLIIMKRKIEVSTKEDGSML